MKQSPKPNPPTSQSTTTDTKPRRSNKPKVQPQKTEHHVSEHMTHRPFAEALKDFFTKETN